MNKILSFFLFFGIRTHRSFRLSMRAGALCVGLMAAFCASMNMEKQQFGIAFYVYLIVCIMAYVEFVFADVLADHSFPFDTERKLALMEKSLGADVIKAISERIKETIKGFRGCNKNLISGAVHIVAELTSTADQRVREGLLQLTDYIGPAGGKKGRVTLINQGIIGRCARTCLLESVDFVDADEYHSAMVREFGFTRKEAESHTIAARSYLAYPLMKEKHLIGVVYFFTTEPQVFPRAAEVDRLNDVAREIINYLKIAQLA
jgi:hypothetical protein